MKNVLKPLAKSFLMPLGLTAAASATDAAIIINWMMYYNNNFKLRNG